MATRLPTVKALAPKTVVMKAISSQPKLVEQVTQAVLDEISAGGLKPGTRIIQEQLAQALGVSRQPVQAALMLLRNQGVLHDAPGRGLIVAPLDAGYIAQMYAMRAVLEGLAARRAAETSAARAARLGPPLIEAGRKAVTAGSYTRMIAADTRFHELLYALSGNTLVAPALATHLTYTQRVMGGVLGGDNEKPTDIWDQHEAILAAICAGDGDRAEALARGDITEASEFLVGRLGAMAAGLLRGGSKCLRGCVRNGMATSADNTAHLKARWKASAYRWWRRTSSSPYARSAPCSAAGSCRR
ncbi:MAG: hypothetical protein RIQ60_3241 [Pseudomonadota bacterium]|jgi:DNA-binding GntR family transcriptional regulator